jgi:hypothetical protein
MTLTACVTKTVVPEASSGGETLGPSLVIERFLRAANGNDLDTMAKLFGTKDGPYDRIGSKKEIDDRMFTFATVLRHTDFRIKGEGDPVSGRRNEAKNILIEIALKDGTITVPFTLVKYKNSWLIEDLCLARLTNVRQPSCQAGSGL